MCSWRLAELYGLSDTSRSNGIADPHMQAYSPQKGGYMSKQTDDLEAVRAVVSALQPFAREEQERIIRWAREKLGLALVSPVPPSEPIPLGNIPPQAASRPANVTADLRGFVAHKDPQSDTHFAATVAYYYQFEAPESDRKESITARDLQEACRLADRHRLKNPLLTLNNAHRDGLLNRGPERGTFVVNSVGENLVAMALPSGAGASAKRSPKKARPAIRKKK